MYFLAELNEFSNLGKGPGTMKVPYAKKWQKETDKLRQIALDCDLTEELKWGKPCFTFLKKNVAIVIPLKESCAFSFFKGALLKDPKHILERIGEHTQAGRWIKFTSLREIAAVRSTLKDYLYEAIELEESGKRIELKKPSEYPIPEELQRRLDDNAVLRSAFATLTPGRRKSYIFYVSSAKQAKTRAARAEKCVPMILSGRGFNERCEKGLRENHKGTSPRRKARTTSRRAGWSASKRSAGFCSPGNARPWWRWWRGLPATAIAVKTPTISTASGGCGR